MVRIRMLYRNGCELSLAHGRKRDRHDFPLPGYR